jgi:outer membrane protein
MYTDNLGVEATIGIPPKHTLDLQTPKGQVASHPAAATVKTWTPAVVGKYFFGNAGEVWRPYLGLGTSNVSFHGPAANPSDATVQAMAGTSVKMSSSWAPVYNAGMIYNIDNRWSVNASVSYLPIKTHVTFVGSAQTTQGDVKINTTDYVIRVGYKF